MQDQPTITTQANSTKTSTPTPPEDSNSVPSDSRDTVHLTIRNTQKVLFDEKVKSITSANKRGVFDILPLHENFISLIQSHITINKLNDEKQTMEISNGVIHVTQNQIHCYIDLIAASDQQKPTPNPPSKIASA